MKKLYCVLMVGSFTVQAAFMVKSMSFKDGEVIPQKHAYTECGGRNQSPDLVWSGEPEGTKSFAIVMDDPDAPTKNPFVHWLVYNIPAHIHKLSPALEKEGILAEFMQGINDFKGTGYDGPCPPIGHGVHRYHVIVYALDADLKLKSGLKKSGLMRALEGHILAQTELIGTYHR